MTAFAGCRDIALGWGRAFLRQVLRPSQNNNASAMAGIPLKGHVRCVVCPPEDWLILKNPIRSQHSSLDD